MLWLTRATAELHSIAFDYVRLPYNAQGGRPGGAVRFRRLPDGSWIIAEWTMRVVDQSATAKPVKVNEYVTRVVSAYDTDGRALLVDEDAIAAGSARSALEFADLPLTSRSWRGTSFSSRRPRGSLSDASPCRPRKRMPDRGPE